MLVGVPDQHPGSRRRKADLLRHLGYRHILQPVEFECLPRPLRKLRKRSVRQRQALLVVKGFFRGWAWIGDGRKIRLRDLLERPCAFPPIVICRQITGNPER